MIWEWILINYVEILGSIFGVLYVILAIKQKIWCWIFGIINVFLYIFVFFASGLYGDMVLQTFYLFMSVYGLLNWIRKKKTNENSSGIVSIPLKTSLWVGLIIIISSGVFGYILDEYTNSTIPYWDGITTSLGITGTWMTARKYLENWWVWIIANIINIGVYYYKELYPTIVFYFVMLILAVVGYYEWKRSYEKNLQNSDNRS